MTFIEIKEITPGFHVLRTSFPLPEIDVGTQMSLLRLASGKFLLLDTVDLCATARKELDELTRNGELIEAVVATHPFHTVSFPAFKKIYPNAKYYGTPRHLRIQPEINWDGDINEDSVRKLWEPEVEMRIPDGSEFVAPLPEDSNHFNNVFVFHKASKTVHVLSNDQADTIVVSEDAAFLSALGNTHPDAVMMIHPHVYGAGLHPTEDAPKRFQCWVDVMVRDWDFDSLASSHRGAVVGGAKQMLVETMGRIRPELEKLSLKWSKDKDAWTADYRSFCECG
ncbi:hypothetical protein HK101_009061 [Irineochytrium annulatum]|nr:hypothetical protein HK101_009061 [Irineochytrium annulatum]